MVAARLLVRAYLATVIRSLEARGLSLSHIARSLRVNRSTVHRWRTAARTPTFEHGHDLLTFACIAFGVSVVPPGGDPPGHAPDGTPTS